MLLTDPDNRIVNHSYGVFEQSYTGQTTVDAENQIIVASEFTNKAANRAELPVMLILTHYTSCCNRTEQLMA